MNKIIINIVLVFSLSVTIQAVESFEKIFNNSQEGKTVEMLLRLKNVDYKFKYIAFYDSENLDIIFDLKKYYMFKRYDDEYRFSGLHEGIEYKVVFKVISIDKEKKRVEADLISFHPAFLDKDF